MYTNKLLQNCMHNYYITMGTLVISALTTSLTRLFGLAGINTEDNDKDYNDRYFNYNPSNEHPKWFLVREGFAESPCEDG